MLRENLSSGFPTTSNTHRAVQPQKMARGLTCEIQKVEGCTIYVAKTKALIIAPVQLICAFVFAYAKSRFSHDVAQITDLQ